MTKFVWKRKMLFLPGFRNPNHSLLIIIFRGVEGFFESENSFV